jgi:transcription factor WhiB
VTMPADATPNQVSFGDLPIKLLQKLDLSRAMLQHRDDEDRPACTGVMDTDGFVHTKLTERSWDVARRYCASCPIFDECDAYATARKEQGVWAGKLRRREGWGALQVQNLLAEPALLEAS